MAKPNLNLDVDVDGSDSDDDLPEALSEEAGGMSDDDFGNLKINNEEMQRISMELNPPPATWEKLDRWTIERKTSGDDRQPGDVNSEGRTYFVLEGQVAPKTIGGETYAPKLSVYISPDKRADKKDPTKLDNAYLHFSKTWTMYVTDEGRQPDNFSAVMAYLRDNQYHLRSFKGSDGPRVAELIGKVEQRKRQR